MEAAGRYLLLTAAAAAAAVSSGRDAADFFQQARLQHTVSRPEDALVFYTHAVPPLLCEPEKDANWIGGDRLQADLILQMPFSSLYYTCSFEGNATTDTNLKLLQKRLSGVFSSRGDRQSAFNYNHMYCTADSRLPDEYFHLKIKRPFEEPNVKCRLLGLDDTLYLRFPGYPTIICHMKPLSSNSIYGFNLPGIVGDPFHCAFMVFSDTQVAKTHTEEHLYHSLINGLPRRADSSRPHVVCSRHTTSHLVTHFQVRFPGGSTYGCNFDDSHNPPFLSMRNNTR